MNAERTNRRAVWPACVAGFLLALPLLYALASGPLYGRGWTAADSDCRTLYRPLIWLAGTPVVGTPIHSYWRLFEDPAEESVRLKRLIESPQSLRIQRNLGYDVRIPAGAAQESDSEH